jgi:hypothetical protein
VSEFCTQIASRKETTISNVIAPTVTDKAKIKVHKWPHTLKSNYRYMFLWSYWNAGNDSLERWDGSRGTALLFFNLGARWGGWLTPRRGHFIPRNDPVPTVYIRSFKHLLLYAKTLNGRAMAQAVSRRPLTTEARGSVPGKSMWDLWWTKWHWDRFFFELLVFPCRFHSTGAPLIVKIGKKNCSSSSFSLGLHKKP